MKEAALYGLREIGTGYHGKEPGESVVDTVRALVRLGTPGGGELGWESCLTTRPFTGRTFLPDRLGSAVFGRGESTGAERVQLDLADALAVLTEAGWRYEPVTAPGEPAAGQVVVAGPLRAADRWCPVAERLLHGEAWRHVVVVRQSGGDVLCLDPLAGGLTSFPAGELAAVPVLRVLAPPGPADPAALALRCLRTGTAARTAAAAPDRDAEGYTACAAAAHRLAAGGAAQRLRLSLQAQAIHALRLACLLGALPYRGCDELALADLLRDVLLGCRAAHAAAGAGDAEHLRTRLLALATTTRAVGELCARFCEHTVPEGAAR